MHNDSSYSVLLDTSFMIRLLSKSDPLHKNAMDYFRFFLDSNIPLYISTIAIAEYCVKGKLEELPMRNLRVLPFNVEHACTAGTFGAIILKARKEEDYGERPIVLNDVKMFAQVQCENKISKFVTSDSKSEKIYRTLEKNIALNFEHWDINTPVNERFGLLDFND